MQNYFFFPADYEEIPLQNQTIHDAFLFNQGLARGLGKIKFHDFAATFSKHDLANVQLFRQQTEVFKEMLMIATPDDQQRKDIDFLLTLGEIFTLVVYGQLILESAVIYQIDSQIIDQLFDCLIRDFNKFAIQLYAKPSSSEKQSDYCLKMLRKPSLEMNRYQRVWKDYVYSLNGVYEMSG